MVAVREVATRTFRSWVAAAWRRSQIVTAVSRRTKRLEIARARRHSTRCGAGVATTDRGREPSRRQFGLGDVGQGGRAALSLRPLIEADGCSFALPGVSLLPALSSATGTSVPGGKSHDAVLVDPVVGITPAMASAPCSRAVSHDTRPATARTCDRVVGNANLDAAECGRRALPEAGAQ